MPGCRPSTRSTRWSASGFPGSGNECVDIGPGWALARLTPTEANIRPGGFISGPTQFALADGVLWYGVFAAIGRIEPMALTSELSIRYLRPCIGSTLWARATIDSAGRRNVVGTVKVWTDDNEAKPRRGPGHVRHAGATVTVATAGDAPSDLEAQAADRAWTALGDQRQAARSSEIGPG